MTKPSSPSRRKFLRKMALAATATVVLPQSRALATVTRRPRKKFPASRRKYVKFVWQPGATPLTKIELIKNKPANYRPISRFPDYTS